MEQETFLTSEGAAKLKAELEELKGPKRDEMAKRLRSAIQMGDLSENADYHKAKEDQAFMEGRIQELEYLLKNATIIDD
jgi:transcription elongation factor GreA